MLEEVLEEPLRTRLEPSVTQPAYVHDGVEDVEVEEVEEMEEVEEGFVADDDRFERVVLEAEVIVEKLVEDVLAIKVLSVKVDGRIEELLLKDEMTVCRVVAEEVDMDGNELLEVLPFVN
jgi:hypothetical protein